MGDVANFSKGTGYSKSDLKGTGSPIILYGRLYTKYETIIRNVDTFVVPKSGSVFSKGGEVIVPGSGETAEDISIASVVELAGILLGGDLNIIYPNSDLDPAFLAITISNGKPHFDMARRAQGKSVVHLHNADLKHILLKTPNLSEQKRISKIFESLDHTITLHEEKKHQLEQLKSALLQKMFADKSGYPPVRFEGFSDEWEQSKLGDVCEEVSGNNGNVKGLPILTISAANGWMNQKDRFSQVIAGNELKKYTLLKKGHLAYNHGNSKQAKYGTVFVQNLYDQALVPRVYHSFKMKTENNPYYVEYYFATKKLDRELARLVTSGARMDGLLNINKKDFFKIKFEVPTPVEQSLISTILQALDQTITLHDQKLSLLKRVKQTLLQKMFI